MLIFLFWWRFLVEAAVRSANLLSMRKRLLLIQNDLIRASISKDVINILGVRSGWHILVQVLTRMLQLYGTCFIEKLRTNCILLKGSLKFSCCWVFVLLAYWCRLTLQHFRIKEGEIWWLSIYVLDLLCDSISKNRVLLRLTSIRHCQLIWLLILRPHS